MVDRMADQQTSPSLLTTLDVEPWQIEIYQDPSTPDLPDGWLTNAQNILGALQNVLNDGLLKKTVLADLSPDSKAPWVVDCTFTGNEGIRVLNQKYREKNVATDVLSFPLLDDRESVMPATPVVGLGSLVISVEWATAHVPEPDVLAPYLMERFAHGLLHLLGLHHDTPGDFKRILTIQRNVLETVYDPQVLDQVRPNEKD